MQCPESRRSWPRTNEDVKTSAAIHFVSGICAGSSGGPPSWSGQTGCRHTLLRKLVYSHSAISAMDAMASLLSAVNMTGRSGLRRMRLDSRRDLPDAHPICAPILTSYPTADLSRFQVKKAKRLLPRSFVRSIHLGRPRIRCCMYDAASVGGLEPFICPSTERNVCICILSQSSAPS